MTERLARLPRGPIRLVIHDVWLGGIQTSSRDVPAHSISDAFGTRAPELVTSTITVQHTATTRIERLPMDEQGLRARARRDADSSVSNPDALAALAMLDRERGLMQAQIDQLTKELFWAQREYEASKHLWRKRYDEQGPDFEDWRD